MKFENEMCAWSWVLSAVVKGNKEEILTCLFGSCKSMCVLFKLLSLSSAKFYIIMWLISNKEKNMWVWKVRCGVHVSSTAKRKKKKKMKVLTKLFPCVKGAWPFWVRTTLVSNCHFHLLELRSSCDSWG